MRVYVDVSLCPRGVTHSDGINDEEAALFKMLDVIVEAIREAIGKLPPAWKWCAGVGGTVAAKNQVTVVDPLIMFGLSKIDTLEITN